MSYIKDVYKYEGDKLTVEKKECHPRKLNITSRYIAPYWFRALQNVFYYEKRREFQEAHHLVHDTRIQKGLQLYRDGHIKKIVVTKHNGGDVYAEVESENGKQSYKVIVKNYLPEKLPQYTHEREEFISNLFIYCTCTDSFMAHYRDNSSMMCKHVCSVLWFLIERFDMPKIFIMPEERMLGWKKSETVELATEIQALPLVKFSQYLNILLLKDFHGMGSALGLSIHKVDNETQQELAKPIWLTFIYPHDVAKIIDALTEAYINMIESRTTTEEDEVETYGVKTKKSLLWRSWVWLYEKLR